MTDLLVVGAGPAGSTVAAAAARAGLDVAIVERARFPRAKLCGEFVSGEGHGVLARLGVLERLLAAGAPPVLSVLATTPAGRSFEARLSTGTEPPAIAVSRAVLDACLLRRAGELGAEVLEETELVDLLRAGGRVVGARLRSRSGGEVERTARVVVAADGRRGTVARLLGLRPAAPRGGGAPVGIQGHLEGIARRVGRRVELHFVRGAYLGFAVIEGGLTNAALIAARDRVRDAGRPGAVLEAIASENPFARERLEGARLSGAWSSVGPLRFGPGPAARDGIFFVGDAAGTVDPFVGEGIARALNGGEALARLLAESLRRASPRPGPETERAWARTWRHLFRRQTWLCRLLGLAAVRPALLEPVVALCGRSQALASGLVAATRPRRLAS